MDFYEILGVTRNATQKDIQKAYRAKVRKCHPDIVKDGTSDSFCEIQKAYETLCNPLKRQEYDNESSVRFISNPIDFARSLWMSKL
jgi:curved DNA-binding protein CbpA